MSAAWRAGSRCSSRGPRDPRRWRPGGMVRCRDAHGSGHRRPGQSRTQVCRSAAPRWAYPRRRPAVRQPSGGWRDDAVDRAALRDRDAASQQSRQGARHPRHIVVQVVLEVGVVALDDRDAELACDGYSRVVCGVLVSARGPGRSRLAGCRDERPGAPRAGSAGLSDPGGPATTDGGRWSVPVVHLYRLVWQDQLAGDDELR